MAWSNLPASYDHILDECKHHQGRKGGRPLSPAHNFLVVTHPPGPPREITHPPFMHEGALSVHMNEVELVVDAREHLDDAGGVGDHAHGALHLGQGTSPRTGWCASSWWRPSGHHVAIQIGVCGPLNVQGAPAGRCRHQCAPGGCCRAQQQQRWTPKETDTHGEAKLGLPTVYVVYRQTGAQGQNRYHHQRH
jgi:hypothetical protein